MLKRPKKQIEKETEKPKRTKQEMIEIVAISSPEQFNAFVEFPFRLYQNHPYWVPPIKAEELEVIDKKRNPVFNNADARFFLVLSNTSLWTESYFMTGLYILAFNIVFIAYYGIYYLAQ